MNENLSENFASQEEIVNNGVTINGEDAISQKQIDNICDELYGLAYYNQDISATIADIKLNKINSPYINVTDIDMRQVAVKITDDIWLYSQSDDYIVDGESVIDGECDYDTNLLDFKAYSENEIKSGISCFYDSIEEVKNVYKDDWKQIALECAFEQGESKFSYGEHLKDELKNFSLISNDTKKDKPYKVVANIFYAPAEEVQSFDNQVDADALVEKLNDTNDMYTFFSVEKDEIKKDTFWAHDYRHLMRDVFPAIATEIVKERFLEAGLDLVGVSDRHEKIIDEVMGYGVQNPMNGFDINDLDFNNAPLGVQKRLSESVIKELKDSERFEPELIKEITDKMVFNLSVINKNEKNGRKMVDEYILDKDVPVDTETDFKIKG